MDSVTEIMIIFQKENYNFSHSVVYVYDETSSNFPN